MSVPNALLANRPTPSITPAARLRRILYVAMLDPTRKFGSLEEQIFLQAQAFRAEASLLLPLFICDADPSDAREFREAGLEIICLNLAGFRPSRLWRLVRLIRRHGIEIIHWNFCSPLLNCYVWALSLLAPTVKHYYTDHNSRCLPIPPPGGFLRRAAKTTLLKRYSKVVAVSRFIQTCLQEQGTWSNVTCCLHFVNTERFKPDSGVRAAQRRQRGVEHRFVVLTTAHLIKAKGVDVVLRALPELPALIVLWVIGAGEEAKPLQELARQLAVEDRVQFLGLQAHVEPFMQAADCFVCPSLWAEAAGLVNIEANACGLPVIGSAVGGIPEYVEDGVTGLLFPPGDHLQLADRVRRLHADADLCRTMAVQARERAVQRFSPEARLADYLDLYRQSP